MERSIIAGWMRGMRGMCVDFMFSIATSLMPSQKCKGADRRLLGGEEEEQNWPAQVRACQAKA